MKGLRLAPYLLFAIGNALWLGCVWAGIGVPEALRAVTCLAALVLVLTALFMLAFRRIALDRFIAGGHLSSVGIIALTILSVPVVIYGMLRLTGGMDSEALIGGDEMTGRGLMWSVLYHFTDPGNQHMTTTHNGQMLAMLVAALGLALMSGVLVSSITNLLDRRAEDYHQGLVRYTPQFLGLPLFPTRWYFGRYAVILGGSHSLPAICKQLLEKGGGRYVFVLTSCDLQALRSNLRSVLGDEERRVVLYYGHIDASDELRRLCLAEAEAIYILGEEGDAPERDVQGIKSMELVAQEIGRKRKQQDKFTPCYLQLHHQAAFHVLQSAGTPGIIGGVLELRPYSFHQNWAQQVLCGHGGYPSIDGEGIGATSTQTVHLVICGMSPMGEALALETAQTAHFPNTVLHPDRRTRITFIDEEADTRMQTFQSRLAHLFALSRWRFVEAETGEGWESLWHKPQGRDFLDIEWEFVKGRPEAPVLKSYLAERALRADVLLTVAVCPPQDGEALNTALYLPEEVYTHAQQVLACQSTGDAVARAIGVAPRYQRLRPFGMTAQTHIATTDIQTLAHKASRIYDSMHRPDFQTDRPIAFISNYCDQATQHPGEWASMPIWQQWSNRYNVEAVPVRYRSALASLGGEEVGTDFFQSLAPRLQGQPGQLLDATTGDRLSRTVAGVNLHKQPATAEEQALWLLRVLSETEHNRWNMEKLLMGYRPVTAEEAQRPFAEVRALKNSVCRAQYCICPFDELRQWDERSGVDTIGYDIVFTLMLPHLAAHTHKETNCA